MGELTAKTELKRSLRKLINRHHTKHVVDSIGSYESLIEIMDIRSLSDVLNLFKNLRPVKSEQYPNYTYLVNDSGYLLMVHDKEGNHISVDIHAWLIFDNFFDFDVEEIPEILNIIGSWFTKIYGLNVEHIGPEIDFGYDLGHSSITSTDPLFN